MNNFRLYLLDFGVVRHTIRVPIVTAIVANIQGNNLVLHERFIYPQTRNLEKEKFELE